MFNVYIDTLLKMHVCSLKILNDVKTRYPLISICLQATYSTSTAKQTITNGRVSDSVASQNRRTIQDIVAGRKEQAKHSVLVEFPVASNCSQLSDIYSSCGRVKEIIDWKNLAGRHFSLVEFYELHAVNALLNKCSYRGAHDCLSTFSRLLCYKNGEKSLEKNRNSVDEAHSQDLRVINEFTECTSVSEQMNLIYERNKLKDIHIRLRFIMCTVLEDALRGMFPYCRFIPVGSTVDGLGNHQSDLNLFLAINPNPDVRNSRFCHPMKKMLSFYSDMDSHILSSVGDIFETFLPGISYMKKNMLCTPPVMKFQHHTLGISCSLTLNNMSSFYLSELIFLCGELDPRVRPLAFTVKQWAYGAKVTQSDGGPSITNFALSLMVIFFLQMRSHPILPPLDEVWHQGVTNNFKVQNDETADALLKEFFYFLSTFQFKSKSISVNDAQALMKPDFSPFYIHNPVDPESNLCRNVTQQQLDHLIEVANCTLWNLESVSHYSDIKHKNLLELLLSNVKQIITLKC